MYRLKPTSLDWALSSVKRYSDTDIFPSLFEFSAIEEEWDSIRAFLADQDLDTWLVRPARTCLAPKGQYTYRVATQLDPLDALIYLAMSYEAGPTLEASRVAAEAKIALSYRFSPDDSGQLFAPSTWMEFQEHCYQLVHGGEYPYVVETDISDFYHRLYHHRIENALDAAGNRDFARVFNKLLSGWAGTPSYGIPVGSAPSRMLAEVAIDDVDRYMIAQGARFSRYVDDYRIFCQSMTEAYERLAALAEALFQIHGLTLQPGKTVIRTASSFLDHVTAFESEELKNLYDKYDELLETLGLGAGLYEAIDYGELDPEAQRMIDELNLEDLLAAQLQGTVDAGLTKFVLRRMAQLDDADVAVQVVEHLEQLYVVLPDAIEYLKQLSKDRLSDEDREHIGSQIIRLLSASTLAHLPFHRAWLLSLFAESSDWGQAEQFVALYEAAVDPFTRRALVLAMGRAGLAFWLRAKRSTVMSLDPWERRAFLYSASSWPKDERDHWYGQMRGHLDPLEQAVVDYARRHPLAV